MPPAPLEFSAPEDLRQSMEGVSVPYNAYSIRFAFRHSTLK